MWSSCSFAWKQLYLYSVWEENIWLMKKASIVSDRWECWLSAFCCLVVCWHIMGENLTPYWRAGEFLRLLSFTLFMYIGVSAATVVVSLFFIHSGWAFRLLLAGLLGTQILLLYSTVKQPLFLWPHTYLLSHRVSVPFCVPAIHLNLKYSY